MSLSKCKECGNDVSTQAKACPHCGARVKKSRWGAVILFALVVGVCGVVLPVMVGSSIIEQKKDETWVVENTVKEFLDEKYGVPCASIKLLEGSNGIFSGTAKLEDGREIDINDAEIDGEMVRFNCSVRQGYEYKCKHHFSQLNIGEKLGLWGTKITVLTGEIWNDGREPIRGFVAVEFVDDKGNVYYKGREIAFILKADQFTGISADYWIPPGKNAIFMCNVPDEVLELNDINARLEFFNLGNEFIASYVCDNPTYKSSLESIPVKVTSQIYKIQVDKVNKDAEQ